MNQNHFFWFYASDIINSNESAINCVKQTFVQASISLAICIQQLLAPVPQPHNNYIISFSQSSCIIFILASYSLYTHVIFNIYRMLFLALKKV